MKTSTLGRLAWLWAGATLTLLACGLVAPRSAEAGCSHYVAWQSQLADLSADDERILFAGADEPSARVDEPSDPPAPPSPCPGGVCSRGPDLPLAPAPDPYRFQEWGALPPLPLTTGPESIAFPMADGSLCPVRLGSAIFHPPRASRPPFAS